MLERTRIDFKRFFVIRYITCCFKQKTTLKTNINSIFIEHNFIFYMQMQKDIFFIKKFGKVRTKNRDTQKIIVHLFFYIRAPYTYTKNKKRENGERAFKKSTWLIREGGGQKST